MTAEPARTSRRAPSAATRERLLDVAVAVLIEQGVARTTTVEVQARAGVSRGTLLHHFPTHEALLSATVTKAVQMNEAAVWREAEALSQLSDPVERVVRALANAFAHPSFAAELELWAVARTNAGLRRSLRQAEGQARDSRDRVAIVRRDAPQPLLAAGRTLPGAQPCRFKYPAGTSLTSCPADVLLGPSGGRKHWLPSR